VGQVKSPQATRQAENDRGAESFASLAILRHSKPNEKKITATSTVQWKEVIEALTFKPSKNHSSSWCIDSTSLA
jgi:hypothetical protein